MATGIARRTRTTAVVAGMALLGVLLVGCEDSITGGKEGTSGGSGQQPFGGGKGAKGDPASFLLTAKDLPSGSGLAVGPTTTYPDPARAPGPKSAAQDPQCQVLLDMLDPGQAATPPAKAASVDLTGKPYQVTSLVEEYAPGQAQQLVATLTSAVAACHETKSRAADGSWEYLGTMSFLTPTVGDARVGYGLRWGSSRSEKTASVAVVQVGDRLVVVITRVDDQAGEAGSTPDLALIRAQVKKLTGKD